MASGDKPWLETWHADHDSDGSSRPRIVDQAGKYVAEGWPGAREQLALAASAPEAVRALLSVEWEWWHDGRHGELLTSDRSPYKMNEFQGPWCPCCEAEVHNHHPQDQKHARDCRLDAALTRAGLPCQRSRDAARAAIKASEGKA